MAMATPEGLRSQEPPQSRGGPGGAVLWKRLHDRYAARIDRQIRNVLGPDDEREDLVQEVLITIFRKIDTLQNPACIDGWVAQVTLNTLKYAMRRRRIRRHASLEALLPQQLPSIQINLHARELAARAMDVMDRLPAHDRMLLTAYWFSPATANSIATEHELSIATVRRRLFRAQARFEKLARRDPALARCFEDARLQSRRWRRSLVRDDEPLGFDPDFEHEGASSAA